MAVPKVDKGAIDSPNIICVVIKKKKEAGQAGR